MRWKLREQLSFPTSQGQSFNILIVTQAIQGQVQLEIKSKTKPRKAIKGHSRFVKPTARFMEPEAKYEESTKHRD